MTNRLKLFAIFQVMRQACAAAVAVLEANGDPLRAVEAAIAVLEVSGCIIQV